MFISFIFYSVCWIEWWILSDCHRIPSKLKTIFEKNIMLTLRRCSETEAVVTIVYWNRHPKKKKEILNYQEYWSSENCNFKGCPFRVTKFLLLNIKLMKHWIMAIIISVSDEVLGSGSSFLPSWKEKKTVMKKFGQFCLSGIWWGEFSSCKCNFDFDIL